MPRLCRPGKPEIHYQVDDFTNPWRDAPYLLLQHGMGRSSRLFFGWIPYLSRFYKVVRIDLRGCGQSSDVGVEVGELRVDDFLDDIVGVLDHLGTGPVHYCGDSFGGILGMTLAARQPERVRTLTLLSSPVYLDEHNIAGVSLGRRTWHEALNELGPQGWADAMHRGVLLNDDVDPKMAKWFADEMGTSRLKTLLAVSQLAMSVDATPLLPDIQAPVLGIYPDRGTLTSDTQERLLRAHVKNLRLIKSDSRYHMAAHIAPARSATQLLYFASQFDEVSCRE